MPRRGVALPKGQQTLAGRAIKRSDAPAESSGGAKRRTQVIPEFGLNTDEEVLNLFIHNNLSD